MKLRHPSLYRSLLLALFIISSGTGCILFHSHSEYRPVHQYAKSGDLKKLAEDIAANPRDLNARDDGGLTPLHLGAISCQTNVVDFLLQKGVNVNQRAEDKATALHLAAQEGCQEVVNLLIAHGAKTNLRDNKHRTPLGRAIAWHQDEVATFLRTHGGIE